MRYVIFFFIYLASISSNAQKDLNLGEVRYDSAFNCNVGRHTVDVNFFVPNICESQNDLEIRLRIFIFPGGKRMLIIFSQKDGKWDAKKYTVSGGMLGPSLTTVSYILPDWNNLSVEQVCTNLIDTLIKSQLFLLPDQSELKHELSILDGVLYIISYKTGTSLRTYSYSNPESYLKHYPDCKEYARMKEIVSTLRHLFYE